MSVEKDCDKAKDKQWLEARKSKKSKQDMVRKSKSKGKDESFIERQVEDELENLVIKTAFSALL